MITCQDDDIIYYKHSPKKKKKKRGKKVLSALSEVVLYHFSMIETIGEKS